MEPAALPAPDAGGGATVEKPVKFMVDWATKELRVRDKIK